MPFACVCCPYCGESFETRLDLSAGSTAYIEDCQVCCRPIEFCLTVGAGQLLESIELRCSD
ncbi:MAG: CPXCG motif-containing cysteine-rich protein [Steroidobacteraceae bacterium]